MTAMKERFRAYLADYLTDETASIDDIVEMFVKDEIEQQTLRRTRLFKELKDKAKEIVEIYILTTPTDENSGAVMTVSKLAQPIIELNDIINKH